MKTYRSYIMAMFIFFACYACDEHDTMEENVFVGEMAPQADWDIASSTVMAGNEIEFSSKYYTTGESDIDRSEVWYSVKQVINKEVGCPWVVSQAYLQSSQTTETVRISQKISEYEHGMASWNPEGRAFVLTASFPTSGTLSTVSYDYPESFGAEDSIKVNSYFSPEFMAEFKAELYTKMKFADFKSMYLGLTLLNSFAQYTDSTFNTNSNEWEFHFPKDASGNEAIPQDITSIYETIPFSDLIFDNAKANYVISYKRSYGLTSVYKVIDKAGNTGTAKEIEVSLY